MRSFETAEEAVREWREKSDRSEAISGIFQNNNPHNLEENHFNLADRMRNKEKVIIRKAPDYNPETIKKIKTLLSLLPHRSRIHAGIPLFNFIKNLPRIFRK